MPMSKKEPSRERRLHPRVQIGGVALMRVRDERLREYIIENLSAGGALIAGEGSEDWLNAQAHLTLSFPGIRPIQVTGRVARVQTSAEGHTSIALKFEYVPAYVQDRIQSIVLRELGRWQDPSVLILHDDVSVLTRLAERIWALDQKVIFARTPLQAMHWLCNLDTNVRAILVAYRLGLGSGLDALAVVAENFRKVRRILVLDADETADVSLALENGLACATVTEGASMEDIEHALGLERPSEIAELNPNGSASGAWQAVQETRSSTLPP